LHLRACLHLRPLGRRGWAGHRPGRATTTAAATTRATAATLRTVTNNRSNHHDHHADRYKQPAHSRLPFEQTVK
jgi:hypothetical protein